MDLATRGGGVWEGAAEALIAIPLVWAGYELVFRGIARRRWDRRLAMSRPDGDGVVELAGARRAIEALRLSPNLDGFHIRIGRLNHALDRFFGGAPLSFAALRMSLVIVLTVVGAAAMLSFATGDPFQDNGIDFSQPSTLGGVPTLIFFLVIVAYGGGIAKIYEFIVCRLQYRSGVRINNLKVFLKTGPHVRIDAVIDTLLSRFSYTELSWPIDVLLLVAFLGGISFFEKAAVYSAHHRIDPLWVVFFAAIIALNAVFCWLSWAMTRRLLRVSTSGRDGAPGLFAQRHNHAPGRVAVIALANFAAGFACAMAFVFALAFTVAAARAHFAFGVDWRQLAAAFAREPFGAGLMATAMLGVIVAPSLIHLTVAIWGQAVAALGGERRKTALRLCELALAERGWRDEGARASVANYLTNSRLLAPLAAAAAVTAATIFFIALDTWLFGGRFFDGLHAVAEAGAWAGGGA